MKQIIKTCKYCGRKMKANSQAQAKYNLKVHEDNCDFKKEKK